MDSIFKQVWSISLFSLLFIIGFPAPKAIAQTDETYVSYNDFYQNLAPYGQWIEEPKYGYVWSPDVDGSFRPYYTSGHWVMTDYGNTWISDYPWGWACFHYGRWIYDAYYGWLWIPGSNWGPAWVSWREGDGFYGWAPLGPDYEFGSTVGDYQCPNDWWVFIPCQYIYTGNYYHYYSGPRGNGGRIKNTNFINNTYENNHVTYVSGPQGPDIKQNTHQPVQILKISNSSNLITKEHNGVIRMYRPAEIRPVGNINGERVTPPNVVAAPQPLTKPQPINSKGAEYSAPEFRNDVPRVKTNDGIGTHVVEAEKRPEQQRNTTSNYEYDVNRPQTQPQTMPVPTRAYPQAAPRQQAQPQYRAQPAAPQQQPQSRPQPSAQPAPQQRATPAQAPAQRATESNGRK